MGTGGALDFSEFMTCIDGNGIAFKDFLTKLETRADEEDYEDCLGSYRTQREVVQKEKDEKTKRKAFAERHPSMAASMKETVKDRKQSSLLKKSSNARGNASETAVAPASVSTELASRV